jgi:hypothetical protein
VNGDQVLTAVEQHLGRVLGTESGRAGISFLGTERIDVLRFAAGDLTHYVTLGMSRTPMSGDSELLTDGPRAELVLTLRTAQDSVLRRLATLAASPAIEGVVIGPGAGLDVGEPLWDGARFTAVLVGEPTLPDVESVRFLSVLPMTPNEAAWKRVHGAAALEERWLIQGLDPRDPLRHEADLA